MFSEAFGDGSSYFSRAHGLALIEYDKKEGRWLFSGLVF